MYEEDLEAKKVTPVLCICCGSMAEWKYSKHHRPYVVCGACNLRIFLNGDRAIEGYKLTTELLAPVVDAHGEELNKRYMQRLIAREKERKRRLAQGKSVTGKKR